jgi:hypothetical protein
MTFPELIGLILISARHLAPRALSRQLRQAELTASSYLMGLQIINCFPQHPTGGIAK